MSENMTFNTTFENMLSVKENEENKLLPLIFVTELFKVQKLEQSVFYFSLLNTCETHKILRDNFLDDNISFIAGKAEISANDITNLKNAISPIDKDPDIMELISLISSAKNERIRMNFEGLGDKDFIGTENTGDILSLICDGTEFLKNFPKNGNLSVLIKKDWAFLQENIKNFFNVKKYEENNLEFTDNIPKNSDGFFTICNIRVNENGQKIYSLNSVGQKIAEFSSQLLKNSGVNKNFDQDIKEFLITKDKDIMTLELDDEEGYKYYIKNYLLRELNELLAVNSNFPKEVNDYANFGHIHYFQLIIYVCLLPYLKKELTERIPIIEQVLQIINDFQKNSLPQEYLNNAPVEFIIKKICGQNVTDAFIENKKNMIEIFHNCMFSKEVQESVTGYYHVTQFNFLQLDLSERTYNDGFVINGKFAIPLPKLFELFGINSNLPELISKGNQQISNEFEYFEFKCKISDLGESELNKLEPNQIIEFINLFSDSQIKMFKITNVINIFEYVCNSDNNYMEDNKNTVFEKFFYNHYKLIVNLSPEQILKWQSYILSCNFFYYFYFIEQLSKEKMLKLAEYVNNNELSDDFQLNFFYSLNRRRKDLKEIFKVISPQKIVEYQNCICCYWELYNFDENGKCKSFIDSGYQALLFDYLRNNLNNSYVKDFIEKDYISELYFGDLSEPRFIIDNIEILDVKRVEIKKIIDVFEYVSNSNNNYTESNKSRVFEKFFNNNYELITYLSAEQILKWQNYIPCYNFASYGKKISKEKMLKLAEYINNNELSDDFQFNFFCSLNHRGGDLKEIFRVILPQKIVEYQNCIYCYRRLCNFDENDEFKSFIDLEYQASFFEYISNNLNNRFVKDFIKKDYISKLYFDDLSEPCHIIDNIEILIEILNAKKLKIKKIIDVLEYVSNSNNNYTESNKSRVFEKFFNNNYELITCLSPEQILKWQNYIPRYNFASYGKKISKKKMLKLAEYVNKNKLSDDFQFEFFFSLNHRGGDLKEIFRVILPQKIVEYQNCIYCYRRLCNFDENDEFESFIDSDYQLNFLKYLCNNIKNNKVIWFIERIQVHHNYIFNKIPELKTIKSIAKSNNSNLICTILSGVLAVSSAIMLTIFSFGVVSLTIGLGVGISAALISLSLFTYSLISHGINKKNLKKIDSVLSEKQKNLVHNPEIGNNIENQDHQLQQNQYSHSTEQPLIENPFEVQQM